MRRERVNLFLTPSWQTETVSVGGVITSAATTGREQKYRRFLGQAYWVYSCRSAFAQFFNVQAWPTARRPAGKRMTRMSLQRVKSDRLSLVAWNEVEPNDAAM
jgi:hypothetical protein